MRYMVAAWAVWFVAGVPLAVAQTQAKPRPKPQPLTIALQVTDRAGDPLGDVEVSAAGPVERSGVTDADGRLQFRSIVPGTYRLRFEHEGFHTLEREIVTRAGQPVTLSVALTAALTPPEPPTPAEPPPAGTAPLPADPIVLSIPDFLEKNLIRGEPLRTSLLACAEGGTARLVQLREPLVDQRSDDLDEILYVVAGSGMLRIAGTGPRPLGPGHFALVPRTRTHSIERQGRNPLILLSILAGAACTDPGAAP